MSVWKTLRHNGVAFPDPYVPKGLTVTIRGEAVSLSPMAEEMAYNFAKKKDTPYVQDPGFAPNFKKHFSKELPDAFKGSTFSDVDFSQFYRLADAEKHAKEAISKEEKKGQAVSRKELRELLKKKYGKAAIDENEIEIANWLVEPPGLFMGRGEHPLRGSWKPRVEQRHVTLNLEETSQVPPGSWGAVVHDHESIWIAKWIDQLTGREKYVWPHESSEIQQSRSKDKYDKALRIEGQLGKLRRKTLEAMASR